MPDPCPTLKLATPKLITVRMPNFWPEAASVWFAILEVQFRFHRIIRQDLRFAIMAQWLTEEIAISVSDVLLGPMSDTPYTDLKMAILHRSKQSTRTSKTYMKHHFEKPQSLSYAKVMESEMVRAEQLEDFPEQPTMCINTTVHPRNLHVPSVGILFSRKSYVM